MALAVCLLFDRRADRLVRDLWGRVETLGVMTLASHTHGRHHPHLSLAVLRSWDLDQVGAALAALPVEDPITVSCHGSLVFPRGRVALAPSVDADLVRRQERVVAAVEATGADLHRNYVPGRWVPHISVATRASSATLAAVTTTVADAVPIVVRLERAALIDSGTGQTWPLPHLI
ncbi:2'-5' RNA ligase family protein [Nocardioides sp. CER19]|uniref:2'-5' RNA ligase family protein n=1 Tax=Nocardioides sp. CER19 TaxID=3038538 RepID=UPI00244A87BF|nr:2'-5' RNA ligase family protein [Nocardioides sp. CER19]MDH2415394.1 2'-5' RNA ligase family protein [Nocardioides sp. CER19]